MKKFALISQSLPPSQSGQSVVLYHLLKIIPPQNYCLVTQKNLYLYHYLEQCLPRLPARYFHLSPDYQVIRQVMKALSGFPIQFLLTIILKSRVRQIKKILTKEKVEVVVVCTGDLFDPPAATIAGHELGIPVILYTFDFYTHQWADPLTKSFAGEYEKCIHDRAARIIVPNEGIAQEYFCRYGIRPVVIHNPFDLAEYEQDAARSHTGEEESGMHRGGIRIVYTGAVYDAHYSAFRNLLAAIPKTGIPDLKLHIYTPQSPKQIQSFGITRPVEIYKPRPNSEMPAIQRDADILFLPLAFNSPYPDIIRTSAPGKTGEYLAAKKPVLVHARMIHSFHGFLKNTIAATWSVKTIRITWLKVSAALSRMKNTGRNWWGTHTGLRGTSSMLHRSAGSSSRSLTGIPYRKMQQKPPDPDDLKVCRFCLISLW